jgi:hypothetical protein
MGGVYFWRRDGIDGRGWYGCGDVLVVGHGLLVDGILGFLKVSMLAFVGVTLMDFAFS